ncbi:hypothetical protein PAHAL_2G386900 [Panicum hallii]|uniref:S-acyltransferase n=1 Tax=Panicum hallii TaxID=206008 RepID=A0A2T8KRX8_9POAL|nr:hypothetical protein PAHAL_2G386900 [Panicum hallii]
MEYSADQERGMQEHHHQGHRRSAGAGAPNGSPSSATCNPIRSACGTLRSLTPSCFSRGPPLPPSPPARVHQVWPGRNVFFLDGRVICCPDPRGLILSAMALLLSEWIFLARVIDSSSAHRILIPASSLILLAAATASLLLAATSDPGIIPRNQASPSSEEDGTSAARFVVVNGVEVRLKFCKTCKIHRPPRSSHCAVCDNCVDKFDHHCPWISQCIGLRNYRFYMLLLCSALAFYTFMFAFTVRAIRIKMEITNAGVFSLVRTLPEPFVLAALSFMSICALGCLLAFHAFLVAKNTTSHEMEKGRYHSSPNPYDKGALANIRESLLEKLPPPRVDFRAAAEPTWGPAGGESEGDLPTPSDDAGGQAMRDARC